MNKAAINKNIEVIEHNNGALTIQNTKTGVVCCFEHKSDQEALDGLRSLLDGDNMSEWNLDHLEYYITDQQFNAVEMSDEMMLWSDDDIIAHCDAHRDA